VSVQALVFDDQGRLLVTKRRDTPVWVLPGGGVDPGESPETAVLREVEEETGLTCQIVRLAAVYSPVNRMTLQTFLFVCRPVGGTLKTTSETAAVTFTRVESVPYPFFPLHRDWIQEALAQPDTVIRHPIWQMRWPRLILLLFRYPLLCVRFLSAKWKLN